MLTFRCLDGDDDNRIDAFCAGTDDPQRWWDDLRGCFAEGTLRPEWCWQALADGRPVATNYWWSRPGASTPHLLVSMDRTDVRAAVRLVVHSRKVLGLRRARASLTAPISDPRPVEDVHAGHAALFAGAGFRLAVERIRLEWRPGLGGRARTEPRLVPRRAADLPDGALVSLIEEVIDGSLDHAMRAGQALGRAAAERMLDDFRTYTGAGTWFAVGVSAEGNAVGYVVPATIDGRAVLAEVGVARRFRGNGYGEELINHGTDVLVRAGHDVIRSDTDAGNGPARAAFARAGYDEFARRNDYGWSACPVDAGSVRRRPG